MVSLRATMCEIMISFTDCDVIQLYMTSRHTFWYRNVCKWVEFVCSKFGYYCFLLRVLKDHDVRYSKWSCWNIQASAGQCTYSRALAWWVGMYQGVSVLRIEFCLNFLNINTFQTLATMLRLNYTFLWDTLTPVRSSLSIWFCAWIVNSLLSKGTLSFGFLLISVLSIFVVD